VYCSGSETSSLPDRSVNTLYYRGVAAGILVFDVTNAVTFDSLEYWLRELRAYSSGVIVVVCGNKADVPARMRAVTTATAADWAATHGCEYFETSAKTGLNVEAAFTHIGASREHAFPLSSTPIIPDACSPRRAAPVP